MWRIDRTTLMSGLERSLLTLSVGGLFLGSVILVACPVDGGEGVVSGQCSDGLDNDGDGLVDCEDEGCVGDYDCFVSDDDDSASGDDDDTTSGDDDDSAPGDDDDSASGDDDDSGS